MERVEVPLPEPKELASLLMGNMILNVMEMDLRFDGKYKAAVLKELGANTKALSSLPFRWTSASKIAWGYPPDISPEHSVPPATNDDDDRSTFLHREVALGRAHNIVALMEATNNTGLVTVTNKYGQMPIHLLTAAHYLTLSRPFTQMNQADAVNFIASVDCSDESLKPHVSLLSSFVTVIHTMIVRGFVLNSDALAFLIKSGDLATIVLWAHVLSLGSPSATMAEFAASSKSSTVDVLYKFNFDPKTVKIWFSGAQKSGFCPLKHAVQYNQQNILQFLVKFGGCDPNKGNNAIPAIFTALFAPLYRLEPDVITTFHGEVRELSSADKDDGEKYIKGTELAEWLRTEQQRFECRASIAQVLVKKLGARVGEVVRNGKTVFQEAIFNAQESLTSLLKAFAIQSITETTTNNSSTSHQSSRLAVHSAQNLSRVPGSLSSWEIFGILFFPLLSDGKSTHLTSFFHHEGVTFSVSLLNQLSRIKEVLHYLPLLEVLGASFTESDASSRLPLVNLAMASIDHLVLMKRCRDILSLELGGDSAVLAEWNAAQGLTVGLYDATCTQNKEVENCVALTFGNDLNFESMSPFHSSLVLAIVHLVSRVGVTAGFREPSNIDNLTTETNGSSTPNPVVALCRNLNHPYAVFILKLYVATSVVRCFNKDMTRFRSYCSGESTPTSHLDAIIVTLKPIQDNKLATLLHIACEAGNAPIVEFLLDTVAKQTRNLCEDSEVLAHLDHTVTNVKAFLELATGYSPVLSPLALLVEARNHVGRSALQLSLMAPQSHTIVRLMLEKGKALHLSYHTFYSRLQRLEHLYSRQQLSIVLAADNNRSLYGERTSSNNMPPIFSSLKAPTDCADHNYNIFSEACKRFVPFETLSAILVSLMKREPKSTCDNNKPISSCSDSLLHEDLQSDSHYRLDLDDGLEPALHSFMWYCLMRITKDSCLSDRRVWQPYTDMLLTLLRMGACVNAIQSRSSCSTSSSSRSSPKYSLRDAQRHIIGSLRSSTVALQPMDERYSLLLLAVVMRSAVHYNWLSGNTQVGGSSGGLMNRLGMLQPGSSNSPTTPPVNGGRSAAADSTPPPPRDRSFVNSVVGILLDAGADMSETDAEGLDTVLSIAYTDSVAIFQQISS